MVQLVEVEDEHFQETQPGPEVEDDDFTDTDSEISTDSNFDADSETWRDRLWALRDIIHPTTRAWLQNRIQATTRVLKTGLFFVGNAAWTISASALLIGVPFAILWSEEQGLVAMEQEQRMREMGGELLTAGGAENQGNDTAAQVGAALGSGRAQAKAAL